MSLIVNWLNLPCTQCCAETINELIDRLEKSNYKEVDFYSVRKFSKVYHTYCRSITDNGVLIRVVNSPSDLRQYSFNVNQSARDDVTRPTGLQAYEYLEAFFMEEYGEKNTLFKSFSGMKYSEEYRAIKNCVPKPITMVIKAAISKKLNHCWKADVSSAYPSEGAKKLPTLHECKKLEGFSKPSKDFPFAFYTKSHHIAIYNELDTHNWKDQKKWYNLYDSMFNDDVKPEKEVTILCKTSEFTLENVFKTVYAKKLAGDPLAKFGMNAAIGFFQKNSNPRLSHLASVIIARCCDRMLYTAYKIEKENDKNIVLFIGTDSIVWRGLRSKYATDDKYLGSLTYEAHDCLFFAQGPKAYQLIGDNGELVTKYAGMHNGQEKQSIAFGKIPTLRGAIKYIIEKDGRITEVNW